MFSNGPLKLTSKFSLIRIRHEGKKFASEAHNIIFNLLGKCIGGDSIIYDMSPCDKRIELEKWGNF